MGRMSHGSAGGMAVGALTVVALDAAPPWR